MPDDDPAVAPESGTAREGAKGKYPPAEEGESNKVSFSGDRKHKQEHRDPRRKNKASTGEEE